MRGRFITLEGGEGSGKTTQAALLGADIATVPYKVIEQMIHHPLTDSGIEKFKEDYCKVFGE